MASALAAELTAGSFVSPDSLERIRRGLRWTSKITARPIVPMPVPATLTSGTNTTNATSVTPSRAQLASASAVSPDDAEEHPQQQRFLAMMAQAEQTVAQPRLDRELNESIVEVGNLLCI